MRTKITIEIEGPDGGLIADLRDELKKVIDFKIGTQLGRKAVKETNTLFTTTTQQVHDRNLK
jgi:hypothetical protein